ncbi:MAG: hypothetical protein IJV32_06095, partial [Bacteroidales bacterium]|nr:hypothetical protein [Bacteroidales bacterium]
DFAVSDGKSLLLTFSCVLLAASRSQWLPVAWEQATQITFVTRQARKDVKSKFIFPNFRKKKFPHFSEV